MHSRSDVFIGIDHERFAPDRRRESAALPRFHRKIAGLWPCCSEDAASRLICCEGDFRAFRDAARLVFGDRREDLDRQPVGVRIIAAYEIDVGLVQQRGDGNGPREPVELRDDQRRLRSASVRQRAAQLRPVVERVALAGLDLGVLGDQFAGDADVLQDGGALTLKPEAGFALAIGADAEISDEFPHAWASVAYTSSSIQVNVTPRTTKPAAL